MRSEFKRVVSAGTTLFLASWLSVGCGTLSIPEYSETPPGQASRRELQGLKITADPWSDRDRPDKYFKENPGAKRIAIIHLLAQNDGDATWLISQKRIRLVHSSGTGGLTANDQTVAGSYGGADAVGMLGAVLISIPLLLISGKMASNAMVKQKNYVDQVWRNQTLAPGESADGFLFFNLGRNTNWVGASSLQLELLNTGNQQTEQFTIPLTYAN